MKNNTFLVVTGVVNMIFSCEGHGFHNFIFSVWQFPFLEFCLRRLLTSSIF